MKKRDHRLLWWVAPLAGGGIFLTTQAHAWVALADFVGIGVIVGVVWTRTAKEASEK